MIISSFVAVILSCFTTPSFLRYPFDNPNVPTTSSPSHQFPVQTSAHDLSSLLANHFSLIIQSNLTLDTYAAIQPTPLQRVSWRNIVTSLLNVAAGGGSSACFSIQEAIPDALQGIYTVMELDNGKLCALVEVGTVRRGDSEEYGKGWGIFVVPTGKYGNGALGTTLHLAAPHPVFDLYTAGQAAHVFEHTGAKSLYIPGRSRQAFLEETDCVTSTTKSKYWKTDPTHDKGEMLFETYRAILDWQNDPSGRGGCQDADTGSGSCAYVQFHGKGKRTCRKEQIFLSAGLGRDPASVSWYTDHAHDHFPIHRLSTHLKERFPLWNVTMPTSPHSSCSLTATKDVVGRLINGVPEDRVCTGFASAEGATGSFVHIEQDVEARKEEAWDTWVEVFLDAFRKQ